MVTWEKHIEEAKKHPLGAAWVEKMEDYKAVENEFNTSVSTFVVWLTGLGVGELVFILSNLDNFFTERGLLFIISVCLLLISIFSGLIFHFVKIMGLYYKRMFCEAIYNLSYLHYSKETLKIEDKELEEKFHRQAKCYPPPMRVWMFEIPWKVNAVAFFLASFCLIILLGIKGLK